MEMAQTMRTENNFSNFLKNKLITYYDVIEDNPFSCDFIAKYYERNAMYVMKKDMEYYAFENNEVILYMDKASLNIKDIEEIYQLVDSKNHEFVTASEDHMSTMVYVIIEYHGDWTSELRKKIRQFSYYKSFEWGFKGWINVGLIVVNTKTGRLYSNRIGKKEKKRLEKMYKVYQRENESESVR